MLTLLLAANASAADRVTVLRVPNGGMKPSIAVDGGTVHMVYFKGDPQHGDAFYVTSRDEGATFSEPVRVNSVTGSVMGVSNIRGPQLALGRSGRAHVLWNGTSLAKPRGPLNPAQPVDSPYNGTPLLCTRLDDAGRAFEPERNLMTKTCALDGGSAIAADRHGNVYAVWHAMLPGAKGEAERAVWVARSTDDGRTFGEEKNALPSSTGACGCCSLTARALGDGSLGIIYRSATTGVDRDAHLLLSRDRGATFEDRVLGKWRAMTCPMSSFALATVRSGGEAAQSKIDAAAAWETEGTIFFAAHPIATNSTPPQSLGTPKQSKHPAISTNSRGESLVAWTEDTGWNKGGAVAWQLFDKSGALSDVKGRADGLPANGSLAAFARADGTFAIAY